MILDLDEKQLAYIEFLVDPNRGSKKAWAEENGVNVSTLNRWEKTKSFQHHLEKRQVDIGLAPERLHEMLNALHAAGKGGDTQAAKAYLDFSQKLRPFTPPEGDDLADVSDEDLQRMWDEGFDPKLLD